MTVLVVLAPRLATRALCTKTSCWKALPLSSATETWICCTTSMTVASLFLSRLKLDLRKRLLRSRLNPSCWFCTTRTWLTCCTTACWNPLLTICKFCSWTWMTCSWLLNLLKPSMKLKPWPLKPLTKAGFADWRLAA